MAVKTRALPGEPANEVLRGPVEKRKSEAGSAAFPAAPWLKQGLYSTAWCPEVESNPGLAPGHTRADTLFFGSYSTPRRAWAYVWGIRE